MADSLKLRIGNKRADGHVPLTLTAPDGGETHGDFDVAQYVGDWTLDAIHTALNDTANRQQAETLGKGLFQRLLGPGTPIRAAWDELTNKHPALPLELQIDEVDLRGYPWELLWDPADHRQARVGGLVRRVAANSKQAQPTSEWPFRLLVIVGADDRNVPKTEQIGADREVDLLKRALVDYGRSIDINILALPARSDLQQTLKEYQPHVVHFIGHGTYDLGTKQHCLVIDNATTAWNWDAIGIRDDFTLAGCVPRFVLLNCCRSASEHASNLSLQAVFTDRIGVGAVVAMQADVRGDHAAKFSQAFYQHALAGPQSSGLNLPTIVEAVREGRRALGNDAEIEWALPALTFCLNLPVDGALLKRHTWPDEVSFRRCREFDEARVYADECDARRRMIEWFYPITSTPEPNLLIVRGEAGSGKSRLLHWCMESWAAEGVRMRSLRVDLPRGKNCLQWLIRLRAGQVPKEKPDSERFLKGELDLPPFLPFYDAVARAAKIMDGPDAVPDQAKRVEMIDTFRSEVTDEVSLAPLCSRFLEGLQALAPLIVVFDQLSGTAIDPGLFSGFRDSFLAPIGKSASKDVRVALTVSRDDYDRFGLSGLDAASARVVTLRTNYTVDQLEQLAAEAVRYREEATLRALARLLLPFGGGYVGLARLNFCQQLLTNDPFRDLGRMR